MKQSNTLRLVQGGLIAAVYCALTLSLSFISYGTVQFRVAEAMTVLPLFSPVAVWGLTVGCFVSNLVGFFTGANIIGAFDLLFGTLATLLAALLTRQVRRIKSRPAQYLLAPLPPVILNGLIVGGELTVMLTRIGEVGGSGVLFTFLTQGGSVALGEVACCYLLGIPLMLFLNRDRMAERLFKTC